MKKLLSIFALLLLALPMALVSRAQTASPFYTGALDVTSTSTNVVSNDVTVGNILSYLNKREFPNKLSDADVDKTSTDLGIGGVRNGDYYTIVLNIPEAGSYNIEINGCHKSDAKTVEMYHASVSNAPEAGETDEDVEYTLVGKQTTPVTGGWTNYEWFTYEEISMTQGINYIRILFDTSTGGTNGYGGNIGGIRVTRYVPPTPEIKTLTVGGVDILSLLDENNTYTISVPQGTAVEDFPKLEATTNELASVAVTQATAETMTATAVVTAVATGATIATYTVKYEYANTIDGYSFTWIVGDGTTTSLSDESGYSYVRESVTNPAFKIKSDENIYSDGRFKIKTSEYALCIPSNAIVSKVTFVNCSENYYNAEEGSNIDSEWEYIKSGTVSAVITDAEGTETNAITSAQNITATFTGHQAGAPILFKVKKCAQIAYSSIIIEYSQVNDNQLNYIGSSVAEGEVKSISGVIQLNFDREISAVDKAVVSLDGNALRTVVKGSSVIAYYWDLDYSSNHTVTFPANSVKDIFSNSNAEAITINFTTEAKPTVEMAKYDYVVSTVDELKAAVAAVNSSNTSADAAQKRIFIKNGDYNVGSEKISGHHLHINKAYNVSIIGESRDGVLIHGTNDGISNAVFSTRYSTNVYIENLTIRNDLDYNAVVSGGSRVGVGVALYGGNRDILKNVTLQSVQDTYVTGEKGYHLNCQIEGTVDYICGGGDHFFDHCTIKNVSDGAVISAPATSTANEWGYVFQNCTIEGADGNYTLGRPWQNEPRAYYLNTTMKALPSGTGWSGMGNLTTHFYEYNSMDASGNALDLSTRGNSPSSTNTYTPVLTADEAAEFTMYNVVGGTDGWSPAKLTASLSAPASATYSDGTLTWDAVEDAISYVIFKDGEYLTNVTETSYTLTDEDNDAVVMTIAAANNMGGIGEVSTVKIKDDTTGINEINTSADGEDVYYNLSGTRVTNPEKGIYIKNSRKVVVK